MARLVVGAALGILVTLATHGIASASDLEDAAAAANVDVDDLQAALDTQGLSDPYAYLRAVGELAPLKSSVVAVSPRVSCIIAHESGGNPNAVNRRSGASGLGQFLGSTWRTTPQGKAGMSVFDPVANRAAISWMLSVGRAREFMAVTVYGC